MDYKIKNNKIFFKKRIPEPELMEKSEYKEFQKIFEQKYYLWSLPIINDLNQYFDKKKKYIILDVACGPGYLTKALSLNFQNSLIFGLDYSKYVINVAKKVCKGLKNVKFIVKKIENNNFKDNFFDLVICKDSLHHFKNAAKAIQEMMRILKRGGILYIQDLRRDVPWYILKTIIPPDDSRKKIIYFSVRASYTPQEISNILKKLRISNYIIKTKKLNKKILFAFKKSGIRVNPLDIKMYFRSRFILTIKK